MVVVKAMFKSNHSWLQGSAAGEVADDCRFGASDGNLCVLRKENITLLPMTLQTKLCQNKPSDELLSTDSVLPSDVMLWLLELRHCTHLYDSVEDSESTIYDDDLLYTFRGSVEYLQVESSFRGAYLQDDQIMRCRPRSLDDKVHVSAYVGMIPGSCRGSQISDEQLISLQNSSLNSDLVENKCIGKSVEQQLETGMGKTVCTNNEDISHNLNKPSVLEGGKNIGQLMWKANPVYRGAPTLLWESETNTLVVSGGDVKLRKLSEEGAAMLDHVMDGVSAMQDVDRCSPSNTQHCGVGNFPVDNDQVDEAAEQYDNINIYYEPTGDVLDAVPHVCKNKTKGIKNVILQNEGDSIRGIYCIQESTVDTVDSLINYVEIQECDDALVLNENIFLDQCGELTSAHLSENGSLNEISFDKGIYVPLCEDINKSVDDVTGVTNNCVKTESSCNSVCSVGTKLSNKPVVDNILSQNCELLLKHFQDVVVGLESMDGICNFEEISMSQEDSGLNSIFIEVENLADEVLEEFDSQSKIAKELPQKKCHVVSCTSSDLSDDVFLNSAGSEYTDSECNFAPEPTTPCSTRRLDINSIFDSGIMPPVRPERKKLKVKLSKTQHADDKCANHSQSEVDQNGSKLHSDENILSVNASSSPVTTEQYNIHNSEDLLLLQKVSLSSKEKRSLQTLSLYEDADNCCGGNGEGYMCNIVSLSPVCGRNENLAVGDEFCPFQNVDLPDKLQLGSSDTDMLHQLKPELSSDECCSPHSVNEDFCDLLDVHVPQVKSISSCQFPPEDTDEIRAEILPSLHPDNKVPGNQGEDDVPEEGYFSVDSRGRSRKGSGSSDIAAWKLELQKSVLSWFDDESENEWFSSLDSEGRVYYFEENSNESSWALPSTDSISFSKTQDSIQASEIPRNENVKKKREQVLKSLDNDEELQLRHKQMFTEDIVEEIRSYGRVSKSRSMVLFDPKHKSGFLKSSMTSEWPQLWKGDMGVLKEGPLNRTKITENGKRLRKNWSPAYVVLTELFLLIFKDAKAFAAMKNSSNSSSSNPAHPELCVDLNGALIEHASKESSRKNVFMISTVLGLQILLQSDNSQLAEKWYEEIDKAIKNLPSGYDSCAQTKLLKDKTEHFRPYSPDDGKKSLHMIERSKSVKVRNKDGSSEDLSASADERQTKIRDRLKKFFHRRPTKELLMKKGIYKDEPVFGRHLADVCSNENPPIPRFVQLCIEAIESKEENMKADGLYRASGNLSQVQKIRLQIDQNNLSVLEQEEDVHVLTGALKLFFRELKSPVIPFEFFNTALQASTNSNKKDKIHQFQVIIKKLPIENRCTLEFLLQHLLKVTKYHKSNRMHISNLAIVFGPTLMWPEEESLNMAFDLMQQNLVIECFLQEFDSIFR